MSDETPKFDVMSPTAKVILSALFAVFSLAGGSTGLTYITARLDSIDQRMRGMEQTAFKLCVAWTLSNPQAQKLVGDCSSTAGGLPAK